MTVRKVLVWGPWRPLILYRLIQLQHRRFKIYFGLTDSHQLSLQSSNTTVTRVSTEKLKIVTRDGNHRILAYGKIFTRFSRFLPIFWSVFRFRDEKSAVFRFYPQIWCGFAVSGTLVDPPPKKQMNDLFLSLSMERPSVRPCGPSVWSMILTSDKVAEKDGNGNTLRRKSSLTNSPG